MQNVFFCNWQGTSWTRPVGLVPWRDSSARYLRKFGIEDAVHSFIFYLRNGRYLSYNFLQRNMSLCFAKFFHHSFQLVEVYKAIGVFIVSATTSLRLALPSLLTKTHEWHRYVSEWCLLGGKGVSQNFSHLQNFLRRSVYIPNSLRSRSHRSPLQTMPFIYSKDPCLSSVRTVGYWAKNISC